MILLFPQIDYFVRLAAVFGGCGADRPGRQPATGQRRFQLLFLQFRLHHRLFSSLLLSAPRLHALHLLECLQGPR